MKKRILIALGVLVLAAGIGAGDGIIIHIMQGPQEAAILYM